MLLLIDYSHVCVCSLGYGTINSHVTINSLLGRVCKAWLASLLIASVAALHNYKQIAVNLIRLYTGLHTNTLRLQWGYWNPKIDYNNPNRQL